LLDLTQIPVSQGAESFLSSPLLPLGISFYTFKNIGYFHDVYSGKTPAERSPFRYAIYLFMFPQVTMGPIQSYSSLRESLSERKVSLSGISDGLTEFILGFGMKAIFADRLAAIWNGIEVIGYDAISTPLAWMGAASYSLQLYFDFAGYSLMALGLCKMLGFESPVNFDHPYAAPSMTEFWRRWHMTLGSWFRDHVYIPLGGNRRGAARTYLNLFAVWLLTGIWHGNTAMFILWGLFLFCVIALEKSGILGPVIKSKVFSHIYMAPLIMISWMIFRLPTLSDLGVYLSRLFPFFGEVSEHVYSLDYLTYLKSLGPLLALGILFSTPLPRKFFESIREKRWLSVPLLLLIFWYSVYLAANGANNPFMYVNF
jgi:alginate O-acetyltransferase complex protein AlgI